MPSFSLIAEGITDQIVIENILYGFCDDPDIDVTFLTPLRDETDRNRTTSPGNWSQVLEYCSSERFRGVFQSNSDYVVIQIDTDACHDFKVNNRNDEGEELSVEAMIESVKLFLIERIGSVFYESYKTRIVFAVAVQSIECWLLPLVYTDDKRSKTTGCLDTLNRKLVKQKKPFSIDAKNKNVGYYQAISDPYSKHKRLIAEYTFNPSLKRFVQELEGMVTLAQ